MLSLTNKQKEYWKNANHRWNIKSGATRSGKTYLDYYMIPRRIREVHGKDGLVMIIGNTKTTLQRNIVEPLQAVWGASLVSDIKSDNTARMFGEKVHCIGADNAARVNQLRGSGIKYCYGDEVVTWHKDVFSMLKSRLDHDYSKFDGTCNPENPQHWFKKFMDSGADIFRQDYTIYDNDFLSPTVVRALEQEYADSVFFDRFILGKWTLAEGLIYTQFANNEQAFYIDKEDLPSGLTISVGVDIGGNGSNHAFVATGIDRSITNVYALKARSMPAKGTEVEDIVNAFNAFCAEVEAEYGRIDYAFSDSAEQAILNTLRAKSKYNVQNSIKNEIIDRIRCESLMLGSGRLHLVKGQTADLANGLREAVWDDKKQEDKRLDDGTSDIDIMDAFEYSWEYRIKQLIRG